MPPDKEFVRICKAQNCLRKYGKTKHTAIYLDSRMSHTHIQINNDLGKAILPLRLYKGPFVMGGQNKMGYKKQKYFSGDRETMALY